MEKHDIKSFRPENLFGTRNTEGIVRNQQPFYVGALPKLRRGQIEIARISLSTTLGDVISIRARGTAKGYKISVVDEYEFEYFDYKSDYSSIPTQEEIFNVIRDMNFDDDRMGNSLYGNWIMLVIDENKTIAGITDYILFDSHIYPDLNELLKDFLVKIGLQD